jgi:hypothetical protein
MKLMKKIQSHHLFYFITIICVSGGVISNNAFASPTFFQCQLKNGQMIFSDHPCRMTQKVIANKKDHSNLEIEII